MRRIFTKKPQSAFAILFAVLISSLLLVVGFSIFNISLKEMLISSFNSGSRQAFYASQTGIECALYWLDNPVEESTGEMGKILTKTSDDTMNGVKCGDHINTIGTASSIRSIKNNQHNRVVPLQPGEIKTAQFGVYLTADPDGPCAWVVIEHGRSVTDTPNQSSRKITSYGYNSCDLTDKRTVERVFTLTPYE